MTVRLNKIFKKKTFVTIAIVDSNIITSQSQFSQKSINVHSRFRDNKNDLTSTNEKSSNEKRKIRTNVTSIIRNDFVVVIFHQFFSNDEIDYAALRAKQAKRK